MRSPIHANNQYKHQPEDREGRQGQITVLYCLHTRYLTCKYEGRVHPHCPANPNHVCEDGPPLKHVNQQARGAEILMGNIRESFSRPHTETQQFEHAYKHVHSNIYIETDTLQTQRAVKYTETMRQTHKEGFLRGSDRCFALGSGGLCGEFCGLELK